MISNQASIPVGRRVTLLVVNTVGLFLLSPALGFIVFLNHRSGMPQIFGVCMVGTLIASVFVWPRIRAWPLHRAIVTAVCASYLPATVGWAVAVHRAFFKGVPSLHQLWALAKSAVVVGGLLTILYWLTLSIVNLLVLRRPLRSAEPGVEPDVQSA